MKCIFTTVTLALMLASFTAMGETNDAITRAWIEYADLAPSFTLPKTKRAWERKRGEIRKELWRLLGDLPPRPKVPKVEILSREDRGDYILEKFQFDNRAGAMVPGYLLLPKQTKGKAAGILYNHWHGGHYDVGKEELFRTNALPIPGGPELARRGYVVCAIDAYGFGERNGKGPGGAGERDGAGELTASKFNLWAGRTLWGMMVRDDLMALDYLCSRPEVDSKRVGVTGISMGATRTWWLMAMDERPRAGVAVCCWTRYQDLMSEQGLQYHGIYYFVPGVLKHFDTEAITSLAAPHALLFQSGELDGGSPVAGIRKMEPFVRSAYALYGAEAKFDSIIFPATGHVYTPEMWQGTLAWFERELKR
ncbi:MAG TPA: alpha/beta hydrolase family protein [Candidatus Acidoferrum sp.]|nr:alpha/beta hydrolase family protein [Candidatus Acidoferrum sp.]